VIERRRTACLHAAPTQLVHEIAHLQPLANGVQRVELAARIERMPAARDHVGG
jgi:hypothetical protein